MAGVTDISLLQNVQTDSAMSPAPYQWSMGVTTLIQPLAWTGITWPLLYLANGTLNAVTLWPSEA
jgi:hypothetical protein